MIRRSQLEGAGPGTLADVLAEAHELPHVHPDHSLHMALERLGSSGVQTIPVVSRANARELLGIAVLDDILNAYGVNNHGVPK